MSGLGVITITDNEQAPLLVVTETQPGSESTGEARFTVTLTFSTTTATEREVSVDWTAFRYTGENAATPGKDLTRAGGTLIFPPGEQSQSFSVEIVDDYIMGETEQYRVGFSNLSGARVDQAVIWAGIIDNDEAGVEVRPTAVNVPEGGSGDYSVRLTSQPSADVTVTVTVPANTDLTVNPRTLTFTTENWDEPQTVTATAAEDDDIEDDIVSLTHTAAGGGYDEATVDGVTVTVEENGFPTLSIADGNAVEDVGSIEFTVTLSQASDKDVSASWSTTDGTAAAGSDYIAVTAGSLAIAAGDTTATIAVTVLDDGLVEPDETFTLELSQPMHVTLTDAEASGTIYDDDEIAVTVEPTALTIGEGGAGSYQVSVGSQPTGGDVTVEVTVPSATDVSAGPATLTFTADNWRSPQFVVAQAASDDDAVAEAPVTLTHAVSGGGYDDATASSVTVTISEEHERGITVRPAALIISEGESVSYSVELLSQPTADVVVTVTVPAGAEATVDQSTLTFTPDYWDVPQAVKVTAKADDDAQPDPAFTLTHTVSGGDYATESADDVSVTIKETTVVMLS